MRRLRALLSWPVAGPIVAYVLTALLTVSVVEAFVARQEAVDTRNRTAVAASRRIDGLLEQIGHLENRLRTTNSRDARERGRLEEDLRVLAVQVRQLGGQPVASLQPSQQSRPSPSPSQGPTPRPSRSPRPSPSPSHSPSPSPSPSPHCILPQPLRCPI